MPVCTCKKSLKCPFKVYAAKLVKSESWQIKTVKLKHLCMRTKMNNKLSAESIAERYLEEFKSNNKWKIRQIVDRVMTDLGIKISYSKAWVARQRAKLMIYGSASEQYGRVWDYGKAVLKYNPESGCKIQVEGIDQPKSPIFLRIFICLAPLRDGFIRGCRPIIGVDGCHLKGRGVRGPVWCGLGLNQTVKIQFDIFPNQTKPY